MESSEFFAAMLGGGISALTAAGFFWWEKSWAAKLREREIAAVQTARIFSATTKLTVFLEYQVLINRHIDHCFKEANASGVNHPDPADIMLELVLLPINSERLTSEELALCLASRDTGLLEKLLTAQHNYLTTYYTMVKINELLSGYKSFKAKVALQTNAISGNVAVLTMPSESKIQQDAMASDLNSLIGNLVEHIEDDILFAQKSILRFLSAVRSIENVSVPKVKIDLDAM